LTVLPGFVDTHVHCKRIDFISGTKSHLRLPPAISLRASVCGGLMGGPGYQREHRRAHHQGHSARQAYLDGRLYSCAVRSSAVPA
jgi:hypothetical protein